MCDKCNDIKEKEMLWGDKWEQRWAPIRVKVGEWGSLQENFQEEVFELSLK